MSKMDMDLFEKRLKGDYYDGPRYVRSEYVVDEDKTVRENKKLAEEHEKTEKAKKLNIAEQRRAKRLEKSENLKSAIKGYASMNLNDKQIEYITDYISENFDDCSATDYVNDICHLIDLLDNVNDAS